MVSQRNVDMNAESDKIKVVTADDGETTVSDQTETADQDGQSKKAKPKQKLIRCFETNKIRLKVYP